jgi:hypothetical protein
MKVSIPPGK